MATVHVTAENFKETVERSEIVLIDYWADWCGPCRAFGPIFETVSEEYPEITFGKCNTEEENTLAVAFGIRSIPTLMVFRERILLYAQPGLLPAAALKELIEKVKELDMAEIRRKMAEDEEQRRAKQAQAN